MTERIARKLGQKRAKRNEGHVVVALRSTTIIGKQTKAKEGEQRCEVKEQRFSIVRLVVDWHKNRGAPIFVGRFSISSTTPDNSCCAVLEFHASPPS